jgi:hypothetical protein
MSDTTPAELPAEVAAQIANEMLDLVLDGKHELWRWEYLLRRAHWLPVAGERVLMPSFSHEAQFAVVRVLTHAGTLVVLLQVTWPALSDIDPIGLLIVAERVVQASSPGSPGTFFLPTIYHELHAETIADDLVTRDVLPAVCGAAALEGYRVRLLFNDATVRDVDLAAYIAADPRFEPLRSDLAYFRAFRVTDGTLTWPNGAEIAAETLYSLDPPAAEPRP